MNEGHPLLTDQDFWTRLEFKASRWMQSAHDKAIRPFWIDGFIPETAVQVKAGVIVEGAVWIGNGGSEQEMYRFTVVLPDEACCDRIGNLVIESLSLDHRRQVLGMVIHEQEPTA